MEMRYTNSKIKLNEGFLLKFLRESEIIMNTA